MRASEHRLWYTQPAKNWNEALPLGNGRIGVMAHGGAAQEKLSLNEDTLWSGYPRASALQCDDVYKQAQRLALAGDFFSSQELLEKEFGDYLVQMYLPLGHIDITMAHNLQVADYARELRLNTAIHTVSYRCGGVRYVRECFVSAPHHVVAVHLTADAPGQISFGASLHGALKCTKDQDGEALYITGNCPVCLPPYGSVTRDESGHLYFGEDEKKGVGYRAGMRAAIKGGSSHTDAGVITVENADEATLYFAVRTSFNGPFAHPVTNGKLYHGVCVTDLEKACAAGFEALKTAHIQAHQALYNRCYISLAESDASALPTDERLRRRPEGDNALYALLFHYGRYLLIASSRKGTQAANLQGIWNEKIVPPWSSNYTLNINTEMNYWPALAGNLAECYEPLIALTTELWQAGQQTAKNYYGASGFCSHHATDIWRTTHPNTSRLPQSCAWGQWNLSSGWLCAMLYEYYRYTGDTDYLKSIAPILADGADFYLSLLTEKDGELILCPATSPENGYIREGKRCPMDISSTMNMAIIRDVLNCAGKALNTDKYDDALKRLRGYRINSDGTLNEWHDEHEDFEPHHRHISHLYGLFPSRQITTRELTDACKKTLEKRGDGGTGWSLAWKINLWARLLDGERALQLLDNQLALVESDYEGRETGGGSYPNLLCAHPPFQIDGNFGACSGIMQMLVQEDAAGGTKLLPALPAAWACGEVYGLCLPGGKTISFSWKDGKIL